MPDHDFKHPAEELDEHILAVLRQTIQESYSCADKDEVSRALLYFLVRVSNTWRSIKALRQSLDEDAFVIDAGTLLRAMLDACLQAEYMVSNTEKQQARANEYLEFEHVEKYKISQKLLNHDNPFSNKLKSSPMRSEGEKRVVQEYERVKDKYASKKQPPAVAGKRNTETRSAWYPGNLSQIAQALGKQDEYDTFVTVFNGCVHTSAFAVHLGPPLRSRSVLIFASKIAARVARLCIHYNRIQLDDVSAVLVERLSQGLLIANATVGQQDNSSNTST